MLILGQTGALFEMPLHILGILDCYVQFWERVGPNNHVAKTIFKILLNVKLQIENVGREIVLEINKLAARLFGTPE